MSTIHQSAAQGFSQSAELYQQARPDYPEALVDWLQVQLQLSSDSRVIDLGAGTGKFIPTLAQVSQHIIAVEPIESMLQQLKTRFDNVQCLQTDSHHLMVADNSIDAVLCAQSFHWFADDASVAEISRVLHPNGSLGLIWNQRDRAIDWVRAIDDVINQYEGNAPRFHHGDWQAALAHQSLLKLQSQHSFQHEHQGSVQQVVIDRCLSTSFIAASDTAFKTQLAAQLATIVAQYTGKSLHDDIAMPYVCYAYHYRHI